MSTFNGFIKEIPDISVDRFRPENLESKVFFLSHCHADHMEGLWTAANSPNSFPGPLYASPISVVFLKHRFPKLEPNVIELVIGRPKIIEIPSNDYGGGKIQSFSVTALPAGHCPGSVMFLFETVDKKILYTGDIRLSAGSYQKMNRLHCITAMPKTFDNIYLDTTFLDLSYRYFPTQFESFEEICKVARDWLCSNKNNIVLLKTPAKYGSEFVYIELAKQLGMLVHVPDDLYEEYNCISDMDGSITRDSTSTRVHACEYNKSCKHCHEGSKAYKLTIKPTAMFWRNLNKGESFTKYENEQSVRICYSSHASYDELNDFLLYFKPKFVTPCVEPDNRKQEIRSLIDNIITIIPETEILSMIPNEDLSKDIFILKNIMKRNIPQKQISNGNKKLKILSDPLLWDMSDL